jgi:hypothetical protein
MRGSLGEALERSSARPRDIAPLRTAAPSAARPSWPAPHAAGVPANRPPDATLQADLDPLGTPACSKPTISRPNCRQTPALGHGRAGRRAMPGAGHHGHHKRPSLQRPWLSRPRRAARSPPRGLGAWNQSSNGAARAARRRSTGPGRPEARGRAPRDSARRRPGGQRRGPSSPGRYEPPTRAGRAD